MVCKSLNSLAPDYLRQTFTDRSDISGFTLRDCRGKIAIPKPRTNLLSHSFSYSGARCCGIAYLSNCGRHKLSLVLNPAVVVSLIILLNFC